VAHDADGELLARLEAVIAAAWEDGSPVAAQGDPVKTAEQARVALRRWRSQGRRRSKDPVEDLAKGLRDHFEAQPELVGPLMVDYRWIAAKLAAVSLASGRGAVVSLS
jgi:hypothetical protein